MARREAYRIQTVEEIKNTARQQMAAHGTAGLTLRGIARAMELSAPALYHYFDSLDDLITALIVDAYHALAEAVQSAGEGGGEVEPVERLRRSLLAYRQWAIEHPIDFQLIYGNPIPGYQAPAEITRPLARRPFEWLGSLLVAAWQQDAAALEDMGRRIPSPVQAYLQGFIDQAGYQIPVELMYLLVSGWTHIHGMVTLEIIGHSPPVIGYPADFYRCEVERLIDRMGLSA